MMTLAKGWFTLLALLAGCTVRMTPMDSGGDDVSSIDAGALPDTPAFDAARLDTASFDGGSPDARPDTGMDAPSDAPRLDARFVSPPTDVGPRPRRDANDAAPPGCGRPLIAECSDVPSIYDAPCSARELHMIGHYQPAVPMVTVLVERTGVPITLSLTSYAATTWNVEAAPGVLLESIVVDGHEAHTVLAPPGVPVMNRSGTGSTVVCAIAWPYDSGGCDTEGLVASLASLTGLRPTSFMGCYEGARYRVGG